MCEGIARSNTVCTTTDMHCCMVPKCLSCYWQDLMDWCWHEPTTLLILARLPCLYLPTSEIQVKASWWHCYMPCVLPLWLKCGYSSLSVALERRSEMVGGNLLSHFQVRWVCGSTWAYCLMNIFLAYAVNGPTEGTHPEARIRHKTVTIIFIASCQFLCCRSQSFSYQQLQQLIFAVYFCSRLRVSFSPCDQTFQIPPHISHPGFQQALHPVKHFHCFQETLGSPFAPFSGTATAGAVPWLQWSRKLPRLPDLEASRQDSCDHYASQIKITWLRRNMRI